MAQQTKKKKKCKCRCKCKVSQKARVRKKSEQPKDTLKKMDAQMPRSNGIVFKVKVKRK